MRALLLAGAAGLLATGVALLWSRGGAVRGEAGLSVLLVTIDTCRADALGAYGHATAQTPFMDALARGGVRFDEAHAQNVLTLPSHANILSGAFPFEHGVRDNAGFRFPGGRATLATILQSHGYGTGAFVSAFPLDSRFGLARGFDVYEDHFSNVDTHTAFVMEERRGTETVALARSWIAAQGARPHFCWVHLYEPHFPYEPPEPFATRFAGDLYHGEVSAADAALGPLLEPVMAAGRDGRTLVVLTADHGESLGEHGEMTHGIFAYEATLRVPLILYAPRLFSPRVVRDFVGHVDLLPTILEALALSGPAGLPGRSLLGLLKGPAGVVPAYFESVAPAKNRGWAPLRGLLRGPLKYVDLPIPELYDLGSDPQEAKNLAPQRPAMLAEMRGVLERLTHADPGWQGAAETTETRERLRALGYAAAGVGPSKPRYTEEDDPKRLIGLDADLDAVIGRYRAGDLKGALEQGEQLARRRPGMPITLMYLGFLYRESGNLEAAIGVLRRALALAPGDAESAGLLGAYLNEAGRAEETLSVLKPFVEDAEPDVDVLVGWGVAQAQRGHPQEALATFERARRIDPGNAMLLVNEATVHLQARDYTRAREALKAAVELNPRLARAHNALGVIAAETGHPEDAISEWRRAVELDPREYDTLFNLGSLLLRSGRAAEARPYLERFVKEAPPHSYPRDIDRVRAWLQSAGATPRGR